MHLVGGDKGGVGRSLVAKLLAQLWIDRATAWTGFDTDRSHRTFQRAYAEFVRAIEVGRAVELDLTIDALEAGVEEVVVDLAGQSEASLRRWMSVGQVTDFMGQLGHSLCFWYVIDSSRDSLLLLESFLDQFGGVGRLVCVVNYGRGSDFRLFEESKIRNHIEQLGGAILELPELCPDSMLKMDAGDKSFWAAIHNTDPIQGPSLTLMQRQRTRVFVRKVQGRICEILLEQPD
jgi:hypothetical protein